MMNSIIALLLFQMGSWASIPPIPDARQEVAVVAVEGLVYVIGGIAAGGMNSSRVDAFDTHTSQWRPVPSVPITVHHPMASAVGHKIYLTGGYTDPGFTAHNRTYEFDTQSSTWTRKADMPTARGAGASATYNGKVYVFGGERDGVTVDEAAVYDPVADSWNPLPAMPTARNHTGAAVARGRIFVVGGRPGNLAENEAFDPATEAWTTKAPLPTARSGLAVTALGRHLYVFGGEGNPNSPVGVFEENEAYDVDADSWAALEPMPLPRHGIGAGVVGNRIYLPAGAPIGGFGVTEQSDYFEIAQEFVLPQFVVGGGYRTDVVISNPAARAAEVQLSFFDMNGQPLTTTVDGASRDSLSITLPPLATRTLAAPDTSGVLRAGTVRVRANARLSAYGMVRRTGLPTSVVYPVSPARNGMFHARRSQSEQTSTGVAIVNQGPGAASLTITLVDESGTEIARSERTLQSSAQLSRFIDELFTGMPTEFSGSMTVRASQPLSIVALAFTRDGVVAVPVFPIE